MIPSDLIQKVKTAVNLVDLVQEYVSLKKTGANYSGCCPFHSDRSPSFSVNIRDQFYYCFGCQRGGDAIKFLREISGLSFGEAFEDLAHRAGILIPDEIATRLRGETGNIADEKRREKEALASRLNLFVASFFRSRLAMQKDYVRDRGVSDSSLQTYHVGYAPPGWEDLTQYLIQAKAPLELAEELGLIKKSNKLGGPGYFDFFRNRIQFPIFDLRRRVVGFGGRTLDPNFEGGKYINSQESFFYKKSKALFGLAQAQKMARDKREIIVVEGYFDAMAVAASGFENVVATCGTALTPDHIQILRKFTDRIIVLFDGDSSGQNAMVKAMETGLGQGVVLYGAELPRDLDPDELTLQPGGREKLQSLLNAPQALIDVQTERLLRMAEESPQAKVEVVKQFSQWFESFQDPVGREVRIRDISVRLGVDPRLIATRANNTQRVAQPALVSAPPRPIRNRPISRRDQVILTALLRWREMEDIYKKVGIDLPPDYSLVDLLEAESLRKWIRAHWEGEIDLGEMAAQDENSEIFAVVSKALVSEKFPYPIDEVEGSFKHAKIQIWVRFSHTLKTQIAAPSVDKDPDLQAKWMQQYLDVQRKLKELRSLYGEVQSSPTT